MINQFNKEYFENLAQLAGTDLSLAHIKQHVDVAHLALDVAGLDIASFSNLGAYSVCKPKDTVNFNQGLVTGKKHWISNIPESQHVIIGAVEEGKKILTLIKITDKIKIEMAPTTGMENTYSGHFILDAHPAEKLFNYDSSEGFQVKHCVALGFLTNHYGLCCAVFHDIDTYTTRSGIDCKFEKQKIKLNLSVLKTLWNLSLDQLGQDESNSLWMNYNTSFAFAKKTLLEICQFILEVTGSGLFEVGTVEHQRFNDALIYSSHMKNLYFCLQENLA